LPPLVVDEAVDAGPKSTSLKTSPARKSNGSQMSFKVASVAMLRLSTVQLKPVTAGLSRRIVADGFCMMSVFSVSKYAQLPSRKNAHFTSSARRTIASQ
jgi:hypothetical protein